jgi:RNA polymerase sigma factor (sigma-70 family)
MTDWPPISMTASIAAHQGSHPPGEERSFCAVSRRLNPLARELAGEVADPTRLEAHLALYVQRLWRCLEYHWRRQSTAPFERLVQQALSGELVGALGRANLLRDVTMAQALELHEERAARCFETEHMIAVRAIAWQMGGRQAQEAVENFAAELILPREGRPVKIAQYEGRTTLRLWLRAVVANHWISHVRRERKCTVRPLAEDDVGSLPACDADQDQCEQLLHPLFTEAIAALPAEDRLLMKMLLLDHVPQQTVASMLGVHSGSVTRRRQRITEIIWGNVKRLVSASGSAQRAEQCLHLVLAGDDVQLRRQLGDILARAVVS